MHGGLQSGHTAHARPFLMVSTRFCVCACPATLHALMGGTSCTVHVHLYMYAWPGCVHAIH